MESAERERELTIQYLRDELAKVETALAAIEAADITDWETFAAQFQAADDVVVKLHQKFSWAASEAASNCRTNQPTTKGRHMNAEIVESLRGVLSTLGTAVDELENTETKDIVRAAQIFLIIAVAAKELGETTGEVAVELIDAVLAAATEA